MGKSTISIAIFSIAMLNYQRVYPMIFHHNPMMLDFGPISLYLCRHPRCSLLDPVRMLRRLLSGCEPIQLYYWVCDLQTSAVPRGCLGSELSKGTDWCMINDTCGWFDVTVLGEAGSKSLRTLVFLTFLDMIVDTRPMLNRKRSASDVRKQGVAITRDGESFIHHPIPVWLL